jgi:hypothetical protein
MFQIESNIPAQNSIQQESDHHSFGKLILNFLTFTFISFARPKEMKQRKRLRKCQFQPFSSARYKGHCYAAPRKTTAVRTIFGLANAPMII